MIARSEKLEPRHLASASLPAGSEFVWLDQPANVMAGQRSMPVRVALEDSSHKILTSANGSVQLNLAAGGNSPVPSIHVQLHHGIARAPRLRFMLLETYKLEARARGVDAVESNSFSVIPGPAARMVISKLEFTLNGNFCQVEMIDRFGNVATGDSSTIAVGDQTGSALVGLFNAPNVGQVINGVASSHLICRSGGGIVTARLVDSNHRIGPVWTAQLYSLG